MFVEGCYSEIGSGLFPTVVVSQPGADQNTRVNHNLIQLVLRTHQVETGRQGINSTLMEHSHKHHFCVTMASYK